VCISRYSLFMDNDTVLVSTMNDVPGYRVVAVYGEVFGLICRARNAFSNIGAGLRTILGGEVGGYTQLLSDSREQAIERLRQAAMEKGANAVLAMRFDCNEIVTSSARLPPTAQQCGSRRAEKLTAFRPCRLHYCVVISSSCDPVVDRLQKKFLDWNAVATDEQLSRRPE
jgi:uncharacterized protein YbjQ (UPF0145 family)